jgi:hypothetical protein
MTKSPRNNKSSYTFSSKLDNFMKEQLQYLELKNIIDDKKNAEGNISEEAWESISKEEMKLNKNKRKLDRRKVYILDKHIFPSLANLVIFFDYLEKNPELRKLFEGDVKELLGFIGQYAKYEDNIITRLLQSILKWDTNSDPNNFRLELISSIQNVLYHKITDLTLTDKNLGDSITSGIVGPDVGRALLFARMFSSRYVYSLKKKDQAKEPNRPINF